MEAGRQHYDGDLTGKWILTAGLGGMGGAQPLAATMNGALTLHEPKGIPIEFGVVRNGLLADMDKVADIIYDRQGTE